MKYCPHCQEPLEQDQQKCLFCGYELGAKEEEKEQFFGTNRSATDKLSPKKKFSYIPLILVLILAILGGAGFFSYSYYRQNRENEIKKEIKAVWLEIYNRSDQINSSLEAVEKQSDLKNLKDDVTDFSDYLATKHVDVINLETTAKYAKAQKNLINSIEKLNKYIYVVKLTLQKDTRQIKTEDYSRINKSAEEAQEAGEKFVAETVFIDNILEENLFKVVAKIKPLIEKAQKKDAAEKKKKEEEEKMSEKRASEKTVSSFMQARIDQSAAKMRRYITPAYSKVFDPEKEFAATDTYSTDFKITKTELKIEDKTNVHIYEINGTETGKDLTGAKFENPWWFKVIKYEGDWLIDNRRLLK